MAARTPQRSASARWFRPCVTDAAGERDCFAKPKWSPSSSTSLADLAGWLTSSEPPRTQRQSIETTSTGSEIPFSLTLRGSVVGYCEAEPTVARLATISPPSARAAIRAAS